MPEQHNCMMTLLHLSPLDYPQ